MHSLVTVKSLARNRITFSQILEPLNPRTLESFDTFKNRIIIVWLNH